tara:strand:+ start:677 stop:778 length:102 start_codon:yes stop_codon:yes gene_type:complete
MIDVVMKIWEQSPELIFLFWAWVASLIWLIFGR